MIKFLPFILCVFLAVASGFLLVLGNQAVKENARIVEVKEFDGTDLLNEPPVQQKKLLVKNFTWGKHHSKMDFNEDGNWDELFVCIFPTKVKQNITRYKAILVNFHDVKNQEELDEFLKQTELEVLFSPGEKVSEYAYANLAKKYKSLDFQNSVVVQANAPDVTNDNAELFLLGGKGGLALSGILFVLFLIYRVIKAILPKKKDGFDFEDAPQPTRNKAGLPSI